MLINISHLNLGRNVRLSVLIYLDFNTSDRESIQAHFDLVHPVPIGSQDYLGMLRCHHIAMPSKMAP